MTWADVTVPAAVASAAGGRPVRLVWANEAGGLTFAAGEGAGQLFIKWAPAGSGLDLAAEADRMAWAVRYHPVPEPLARGQDDDGAWLVTAALPGDRASSARWKADPATAVTAIGERRMELRARLGTAPARRLRNPSRPRTHPLLPPAVGPQLVTWRWLSQLSTSSAISRQPWSMVSE